MKKLMSLAGALALALSSAGTAYATTVYPSAGGTWNYGNGSVQAYSNYHHPNRNHTSSLYRSGVLQSGNVCVRGGTWAYATKYHAPWTGGFAYYHKYC